MKELTVENYLELKNSKLYTRPQMAGLFGIPEWKLKRWISENNLGTKLPTIASPRAFKEFTPQSSYWAGFIAADGCVDEKGRLRFYLQLSDSTHLEKFAKFVESTHKINLDEKRNRCSIEFTCTQMVADLEKWNIVPRKSLEYCPPDNLPYMQDFLRGYFDGDGTICESFSNVNSKTATLYAGLACSYNFRDWLVFYLPEISSEITLKQYERANHVTITMNTNKSIAFLSYLYKDSAEQFRLSRKYELYVKTVVNNDRKTR